MCVAQTNSLNADTNNFNIAEAGQLTFEAIPHDGMPSHAEWMKRAGDEYNICLFASKIVEQDDKALYAKLLEQPETLEALNELLEQIDVQEQLYKDGAEFMRAALSRLMIVLSRYEANGSPVPPTVHMRAQGQAATL